MEAGTQQPQASSEVDEKALEAQVRARQEARRRKEEDQDGEPRPPREVIQAAAKGEKISDDEVHDALEVFLAQEGDDPSGPEPKELKLNVGSQKQPQFVRWVIGPIDDDEIQKIRKASLMGSRAARRRGDAEVDENLVARRIVAKATLEPDIKALAKSLNISTDPADAVLAYFRRFRKTGLIVQISGEVLGISGYDEDDVSEFDAALG